MAIEIGDKVTVSIPSSFPAPFDGWSNGWKDMLRHWNGKEIEVIDNNSELSGEKGIEFDRKGSYLGYTPFIPFQWVIKNYGTPINGAAIHETKVHSYMWCNACGGSGKHRLMCPVAKATVKFT